MPVHHVGRLVLASLSDGCARFSTTFYPVSVTNLTSGFAASPVRQKTSLRIRVLPTSSKYSSFLYFVKCP